jgi:hypothetical protein
LCLALLLVTGAVLIGAMLQLAPREVRESDT